MSKWKFRQDRFGNWHAEEEHEVTLEAAVVTVLSIVGVLFAFLLLLAVLLGVRNFRIEIREDKEQRAHEAQMKVSVSVWDLDIIESTAINGSTAKHDSYGNAYSGEFREFCAWNSPYDANDVFVPRITVDINEKYEYTRFTGTIFTRPKQNDDLTITFKVFADGKCIYDSGKMDTSTRAIDLDLNVAGVDKLTFEAYSDHFASTNPAVILANATLHAK